MISDYLILSTIGGYFLSLHNSLSKVYNEQIRDLLVSSGPLAVREDGQQGVVVQGLTLHQVCKYL